jgi:outer membrane lipoprotein SlyB
MRTAILKLTSLAVALALTGGCVSGPPRHGEYRYGDARYSDQRYDDYRYQGDYVDDIYHDDDDYDGRRYSYAREQEYRYEERYADRCQTCGTIERVEQVWVGDSSIGGGTVLGAIIGGAIGSNVGSGSGRQAATVAGAIAGGAIGHQIEQDRRGQRQAYQFELRLDDGRWARVVQYDNPGLRVGDRVEIRNQQLGRLR